MSRRPRAILAMFALATGLSAAALGEGGAVSEYGLKAVLFYKLPSFVYLPERAADKPLGICVLGRDPFGGVLENLSRRAPGGRPATYQLLAGTAEAGGCDFVFISRSEAGSLDGVLRRLGQRGVVTVSDIAGFASSGGMVELSLAGDRQSVSILINRRAAQRQGIEFNAQLLRLAKLVES